MDFIIFVIGVAVGAAFSPFWIKLWQLAVAKIKGLKDQTPPSA